MLKGGYYGGSTVIGPRKANWFSYGRDGGGGSKKKWGTKSRKRIAAAVSRHETSLAIENYHRQASILRKAGATEKEIRAILKRYRSLTR